LDSKKQLLIMCGINGIFAHSHSARPIVRDELLRTRDHMAARGPDGAGCWVTEDGRLGLGHRRLSIIDLSDAGAQPMMSSCGRFAVTFNGEIYNHRLLRSELEARGRRFKSCCDTEVLLHLYAEKGEAMVRDLRGMFAFAIWDRESRSLLLARDPYGIKPLYYADDGATFRFASQVKALLAGGALSLEPDPAGQVGFALFGHVPEPFTAYRDIRALPAGTTLAVDASGPREPRRYHSIAQVYSDAEAKAGGEPGPEEALASIREALLDSVRHHLIADVPVGAFLSAGVDSSALVGLMRDAGQDDIQTVTLAFEEFRGSREDEAPLAESVARRYGTRHTTRVVTAAEFVGELPQIFQAMDQPSIDGVNTWFVSKAAHELGLKVAVSGLGGDELFGGYPSFRDIPRWVSRLGLPASLPLLGKGARRILAGTGLGRMFASPKAAGMLEYGGAFAGAYLLRRGLFMPWELEQALDKETVRQGLAALQPLAMIEAAMTPAPASGFAKVAALESSLFMRNQLLRDTDWASMAHSLEVRAPLVDATLLERIAPLTSRAAPGAFPKAALASAPRLSLPQGVLERAKTGFGVPTGSWLSRVVDATAQDPTARKTIASKGEASRAWSRIVLHEAAA
jgi:asparagine synthase (glutamine-hydrolysing)